MNQPSFNSIINFIGEFFSELPPTAVAAISGIGICAILVFCGYILSFVVAFFVYAVTQSGPLSAISLTACIAAFSIVGIIYGFKTYSGIKRNYEKQNTE